jgi:hypothetical protein
MPENILKAVGFARNDRTVPHRVRTGRFPVAAFFFKEKGIFRRFSRENPSFSKKYPDLSFFTDRIMFPICNRKGQLSLLAARPPREY